MEVFGQSEMKSCRTAVDPRGSNVSEMSVTDENED